MIVSPSAPTWLDQGADLDELLRPPQMSPALGKLVFAMADGIRHSSARIAVSCRVGGRELAVCARLAATTLALEGRGLVTIVMFYLDDQLETAAGDAPFRALVHAYAMTFSEEKWRSTRWFVGLRCGALEELKVASHRRRRVWFLQRFAVARP